MLENINDSVDRTFARILNITSPNAKTNGYDANCFTDGKCYHRTFNNPKGIVSNWKNSSSDVTMTYRSDSGNFISNAWVAISDFFTGIFNYFSGNNVVLELDNTKPYDQLYIYHKGNVHVEGLSYQRSFTPADGSYYTMRFYYITIKGASDSYCKFISVTTPDGLTVSCTYDAVTEISAIKAESDITDGAPDLFLPTWSGIISNLP
jgi:hypothetical protein